MTQYKIDEWIRDFGFYFRAGESPDFEGTDPESWIEDYFDIQYPGDSNRKLRFGAATRFWHDHHRSFDFGGVSVVADDMALVRTPLLMALYDHFALCEIGEIHADPKLG